MSDDLKLCPECGSSSPELRHNSSCDCCAMAMWSVRCLECDHTVDHCKRAVEAVKRWNSRPLEDALRSEVSSLKDRIQRADTILDYLDGHTFWNDVDKARNALKGIQDEATN